MRSSRSSMGTRSVACRPASPRSRTRTSRSSPPLDAAALMRTVRLLWVGWLFHMKMLTRSAFNFVLGIIYPLFFATVAFFMFQAGDDPKPLLYASLGAAVMGIWGATSTSAGNALARERWHGTLELLVAAPTHFALVILPVTVAMATIGIYSMVTTLLWGWLVFGIDVQVGDPLAFTLAVPATVVSIGA